jgi:hypothetical protein
MGNVCIIIGNQQERAVNQRSDVRNQGAEKKSSTSGIVSVVDTATAAILPEKDKMPDVDLANRHPA